MTNLEIDIILWKTLGRESSREKRKAAYKKYLVRRSASRRAKEAATVRQLEIWVQRLGKLNEAIRRA